MRQHWRSLLVGLSLLMVFVATLMIASSAPQPLEQAGDGFVRIWTGVLTRMDVPEAEREGMLGEIERLAGRIRSGELSHEQSQKLFKSISQSPVLIGVLLRCFEVRFLTRSDLDGVAQEEARKVTRRYYAGIRSGRCDRKRLEEFERILCTDDKGTLKEALTSEEIGEALDLLKAEADAAGVDAAVPFDLTVELRTFLEEHLSKGS